MEKTFGIVPLRLKDEIKQSARQKGLRIMMTSPIESSCELTELIQIKQLPVFALVLQGKGAVQVWSSFIKELKKGSQKDIFYASNTLEDAEREIRLFQAAVTNDLSVKKNMRKSTNVGTSAVQKMGTRTNGVSSKKDAATSTTRSVTTKSTLQPNNNNRQQARNVVASSRKASDGVTNKKASTTTNNSPTATNKKLLAPKGGVSKNTPPKSVVTGRTRKVSKVSEKNRPAVHSERNQVTESVIKEAIVEESVTKDDEQQEINLETEEEQEQEKEESDDIQAIKEETEQDEITPIQHESVSHLSICSSAVSDEHDAEVAAATRMMKNDTAIEDSLDRYSPIKGRSSSTLSPNSVASLPRPETPEVSELRLKFENIIQTGNLDKMVQRPTSKMSNEFISRIKEMKPRDPTGSRVKSMVEFFMDENLNKWEF